MRTSGSIAAAGRWALFLAYLTLTIVLSSLSHVPGTDRLADYLLHAPEFAVMTLLLIRALSGSLLGPHSARALWIALGFGVVYGILDELHQSFVPGRDSSVKDAAVDAAATCLTVFALARFGRKPGSAKRAEAGGEAPRIELLSREGCHLCEDARGVLVSALGAEGGKWREVDITRDPELASRYGLEIPVLLIDGVKRFKGKLDTGRLARLLEERDRLRRRNPGGDGGLS